MQETRRLLKNVGVIDPTDAEAYIAAGGYAALRKALTMDPAAIIDTITAAGLRGRGGAGFPTGRKWAFTHDAEADQKYIVCNADEGEPGTNKDKLLMTGDPNLILEGMAIAGRAVGANKGYIYLRCEYPYIFPIMETAIANAKAQHCLGESIFGSDFDFDIEVCSGGGAYVCGEESALLNSLEGKRGEPRFRPPYPAVVGLYGKPTVINNVETLANVPLIIDHGVDWYRSMGTETCPGTKLYCISGNVNHRGAFEFPMGANLKDLIYDVCGGIQGGRKLLAVQTGGASGPVLNAEQIDINLDVEQAAAAGAALGSGAILVIDDSNDIIHVLRGVASFFADESCGNCTPCREGTHRMYELISKIAEHKATAQDIDTMRDVAEAMTLASLCGLGQTAPVAISSALDNFPHVFASRLAEVALEHA